MDKQCQWVCNNAACDFDSDWCTHEARAEIGRAQLSALSGETSAAISRLTALVNLTSELSPEQQSIVRRAHRMVDSLKHGMILRLPPNEVGVLSFEAYTSRIKTSADTLEWLEGRIQHWESEKKELARHASQREGQTELQGALETTISEGLKEIKSELDSAFTKLDSRLKLVGEELHEAIASVGSEVRLVRDLVFANREAIHRVQHRLGGLSDQMRGISKQLGSMHELLRNPPSNSPSSSPSYFPWDADQNERVEREELNRLLADFELIGSTLAEAMNARFSEFTHPSWGELLTGEFSSTSSIGDELVAYTTERDKLPDSLADELLGSATVLQSAKVRTSYALFSISLPLPSSLTCLLSL